MTCVSECSPTAINEANDNARVTLQKKQKYAGVKNNSTILLVYCLFMFGTYVLFFAICFGHTFGLSKLGNLHISL